MDLRSVETSTAQKSTVYLDHSASTPLRPEAAEAMSRWLGPSFGNPSGSHGVARRARTAIEEARDLFAEHLAVPARTVIFTSGGTESLNLAISGHIAARTVGSSVWTSAIEHDAVRNVGAAWGRRGFVHEVIEVDSSGRVDADTLAARLKRWRAGQSRAGQSRAGQSRTEGAEVAVVAVMAVNNEVGTIQSIEAIASAVRSEAPEAVLVVDAVQAAPWLELGPVAAVCDFVALSAHKFGGPQGVGVLVGREGVPLEPLLFGGGQEQERRSGTQNVAGIVGAAAAFHATCVTRAETTERVRALRDRLVDGLCAEVPGCVETVPRDLKVPGNGHVCIDGVENEALLVLLDDVQVAASAGSACASGAVHASPVLLAMGVPKPLALGALRLTLGWTSTDADVDRALSVIPACIRRLR